MTNLVASRPAAPGGDAPTAVAGPGLRIGIPVALVAVIALGVATGNGVYVLGFLGFVVALLVSVTLHEAGHFLTARHYGMKSTQFFVGFGPTLWSRRRGELEYGVKAVPAGGFVKIVGMTQLEELDADDDARAFWRRPARQRAVVLAAGSTVHFIIAVLLVLLSAMAIGRAVETAPGIGEVSACVPASATATCDDPGAVPAPALAAGFQAGDVVQSVGGAPVDSTLALVTELRAYPDQPVVVEVLRDGEPLSLTVTPTAVQRPSLEPQRDAAGEPVLGPDGLPVFPVETVGAIGVLPQFNQDTERLGPVEAVEHSVETGRLMVTGIVDTFTEKLGTITQVYGPDRDPAGFVGVVGAGRISGEVIASQETFSVKVLSFLLLIAGLNLFVGVFNLLPLLPLDGGHLAVLAFEKVRHSIKRARGYTGEMLRVDLTKLLPITYGVVLFFGAFTIWLLGADIVNPIRLS